MSIIKNARIVSTILGPEDHGIFTFYLNLDYGDSTSQSYGGGCLDTPLKTDDGKFIRRIGSAWGLDSIMLLLQTLGVDSWESLKGIHIRVEKEDEWGRILRVGHLLKDNWYDAKTHFEEFAKGKVSA